MGANTDVKSHSSGPLPNKHGFQCTEPTAEGSRWKPSSQVILILVTLSCVSFIIALGVVKSRNLLAL